MNLKLGIVLEKKPDIKNIDSIVEEVLYPYLSYTPVREIVLKDCKKNDMKDKYKSFKEESYRGVSSKKRKEDMVSKGIDTFEGFCKKQHGIIRFNENKDAVISFNPKAFIDEYEIKEVKRINQIEDNYLVMNLKALINKDLKVYHRELQVCKVTPSVIIEPVVNRLKKTDYVILIEYVF